VLLLTVLLLASQDGPLRRHRHHGGHCVICVYSLNSWSLRSHWLRLAEIGYRGLVVHGRHWVPVERQAGRGALGHYNQGFSE
jgi:hypothetical protein